MTTMKRRPTVNRRQFVAGAVGASMVAGGLVRFAAAQGTGATPTGATPTTVCTLTSEVTEGPYYVANELVRQNIVESKQGVPLRLRIAVTDTTANCAPLANAAVDIWHCDALGYYSGITGENPGGGGTSVTTESNADTTFLRGIQLTDDNGLVEFDTIYPGWYTGRTLHIHLKVHIDGTIGAATPAAGESGGQTYDGGHVAHTGQLFFDDDISDQVLQLAPYAMHTGTRVRNDNDNVLDGHTDEPGFFLNLTPITAGKLEDGFIGTIALGVNPNATSTETGSGPGGPGDPGQGGAVGD